MFFHMSDITGFKETALALIYSGRRSKDRVIFWPELSYREANVSGAGCISSGNISPTTPAYLLVGTGGRLEQLGCKSGESLVPGTKECTIVIENNDQRHIKVKWLLF